MKKLLKILRGSLLMIILGLALAEVLLRSNAWVCTVATEVVILGCSN